jgi:hypothetical protein
VLAHRQPGHKVGHRIPGGGFHDPRVQVAGVEAWLDLRSFTARDPRFSQPTRGVPLAGKSSEIPRILGQSD